MRGGRNKFGPMYKRDRARKLQVMRERQMTTSTTTGVSGTVPGVATPGRAPAGSNNSSLGNNSNHGPSGTSGTSTGSIYSELGYSSSSNLYTGVKHEIQIPQVSSLTSSPDSSPSPLTTASVGFSGKKLQHLRVLLLCNA